jgi:hypothetical protein
LPDISPQRPQEQVLPPKRLLELPQELKRLQEQ